MLTNIQDALTEQARQSLVTILYACESGSRAWGFASPDSDYDVRFIYAHPMDWYLSIFTERDVIEQPINDLLDISGWDLRKALLLLFKSNAPLLEWLHSPITYICDEVLLNKLRDLARSSFQPRSVCHHYLAMAKRGWDSIDGQPEVKLKRYFYVLRALLCCEWIIREQTIPPVEFKVMLDKYYPQGAFREGVTQMLMMKVQSNETDILLRDSQSALLSAVDQRINDLMTWIPLHIPENTCKPDKQLFDRVFRELIAQD